MRGVASLLITIAIWQPAIAQPPQKADSPTREFPELKCRYTLAGKDWKWQEPAMPTCVFSAIDKHGDLFALSCSRVPPSTRMNQELAGGFEQALNRMSNGQLRKRGGRFVIFKGLPCYQSEGIYPDGRTTVSRLFLANDIAFHLLFIGGKAPVELRSRFRRRDGRN